MKIAGWRVVAGYSTTCFCGEGPQPKLPPGPLERSERRMFRRMAAAYAEVWGLENLLYERRGHVASGELIRPCVHRQAQIVRLHLEPVFLHEVEVRA